MLLCASSQQLKQIVTPFWWSPEACAESISDDCEPELHAHTQTRTLGIHYEERAIAAGKACCQDRRRILNRTHFFFSLHFSLRLAAVAGGWMGRRRWENAGGEKNERRGEGRKGRHTNGTHAQTPQTPPRALVAIPTAAIVYSHTRLSSSWSMSLARLLALSRAHVHGRRHFFVHSFMQPQQQQLARRRLLCVCAVYCLASTSWTSCASSSGL